MDADAVELRVLGCLIEKQRTTPDVYPLSLNSLRLACNQATNRDPVVDYDEGTIRAALDRLSRKGWARLASGAGSRAARGLAGGRRGQLRTRPRGARRAARGGGGGAARSARGAVMAFPRLIG